MPPPFRPDMPGKQALPASSEAQEGSAPAEDAEASAPSTSEVPESSSATEASKFEKSEAKAPPLSPKAARLLEIKHLLGPDIRIPGEIPVDYRPSELAVDLTLRVKLPSFVGPLDLLLYLVRKHEFDIFDIPIAEISQRYDEMLATLESLEVDLAAEFLAVAAELSHIKSKMLLPAKEGVPVEDLEEDGEDPREALIRRLLVYQKYQNAALRFDAQPQLGRDTFERVPSADGPSDLDPGLKSVDVFRLLELMAKMLKKKPVQAHAISFEVFSVSERIQSILAFGEAHGGQFALMAFMETVESRAELVVSFIAILEATKLQLIRIRIDDPDVEASAMAPTMRADACEPDALDEADAFDEDDALDEDDEALKASILNEIAEDEAQRKAAKARLSSQNPVDESPADDGPADDARLTPSFVPEPLPVVWVEVTGKAFSGELLDDYR